MADWVSKVNELGELLDKHGLTAIRVEENGQIVEVRREQHAPAAAKPTAQIAAHTEERSMPSPMTGTFYRRRSPSDPALVNEGDHVSIGQVIGLIEAMKVFSEIEATQSGVVSRFAVDDGQLVAEGDPILYFA